VVRSTNLPKTIQTDAKRLQQILKNLLSNAFKFTESGKVSLTISSAREGWNPENETLNRAKTVLVFSVTDTGIGISADKQHIIFEAFQQADGSTSRKYGGTGLGLAISREITRLLGGDIRLVSVPGEGSTFTLFLPQNYVPVKPAKRQAQLPSDQNRKEVPLELEVPVSVVESEPPGDPEMDDDDDNINPEDRVLLIVENDTGFAQLLMEMAHESGFKALISPRGADALTIARERKIEAITLDINLHDLDGWRIMARLKDDIATRHIPIYIITTEDAQARGLRSGALGVLNKPLKSREELKEVFARFDHVAKEHTKHLLIANKDESQRHHLMNVLQEPDLQISEVNSAAETLTKIRNNPFGAVVIGPELADMSGLDLIEEIKKDLHLSDTPIIAYVPGNISKRDESHLKRLGHAMNLKEVHSEERLLDECALFLHQNVGKIKETKREIIQRLYQAETVLKGKNILIVDDDIRNIFAMTSLLERYEMSISSAETGKIALEQLQSKPDIDAVLMDIMMPDMDGYDTMRAIRKFPQFRTLPMIAVTAKAMKGDRDKCIEAGASDYIAKPVDSAELLSMLRLWLHR
jgi:CheY-like chemotaxis protein